MWDLDDTLVAVELLIDQAQCLMPCGGLVRKGVQGVCGGHADVAVVNNFRERELERHVEQQGGQLMILKEGIRHGEQGGAAGDVQRVIQCHNARFSN